MGAITKELMGLAEGVQRLKKSGPDLAGLKIATRAESIGQAPAQP